jgi:Zn finger protein HypA/HybF involved in hydrogenase expression
VIVGCPTCGAEVEFRYDDSFVRVCGHCRSAVVRTDRGVDTLGRFADLVPIASALQLFAEGRHGTTGFLLIGMAQLRHAAGGVWQEWYAKLDGGQWAWISEAQGRLYLTFERPDVAVPSIASLAPGTAIELAGATFTVAERGTATYVSAQGEIPYRLVPASTFQFVDLSDGRGGFATIDYGDGSDPPAVYVGYQVTPQGLGISGGEAPPQLATPATGARLACPSCNGSLELRAPDQTLRVACPYCSSLVSVEGGTLAIIAKQARKPQLAIALGSKATFLEGELTVIGYVGRSACIEGTWWPFEEYLLYAPSVGFRWLV